MATIRVVLDTNVLVGKHRHSLLAAAGLGIFELVLSPYILGEVREVLVKDFGVPEQKADDFISSIKEIAVIVDDSEISGGNFDEWLYDLDDHPVMATALIGKADYLVTANIRDFPPKKKFAGTTMITPEALAARLKIGLKR